MKIVIPLKPVHKIRHRSSVRNGRAIQYDIQKNEAALYAAHIMASWGPFPPISGPVIVKSLVFRFERPKSHFGAGKNADKLKPSAPIHHTSKPDIDNLIKFLFDCANGIVFFDDKQVVRIVDARKKYCETGDRPGTEMDVELHGLHP